jgi:hypothetical protein
LKYDWKCPLLLTLHSTVPVAVAVADGRQVSITIIRTRSRSTRLAETAHRVSGSVDNNQQNGENERRSALQTKCGVIILEFNYLP